MGRRSRIIRLSLKNYGIFPDWSEKIYCHFGNLIEPDSRLSCLMGYYVSTLQFRDVYNEPEPKSLFFRVLSSTRLIRIYTKIL